MTDLKSYEEIMAEARAEAHAQVVRWQLESRLGRELTEAERKALTVYTAELGIRSVALAVFERDADALLRWLHASAIS